MAPLRLGAKKVETPCPVTKKARHSVCQCLISLLLSSSAPPVTLVDTEGPGASPLLHHSWTFLLSSVWRQPLP